jgi:transcription termination factor Rho
VSDTDTLGAEQTRDVEAPATSPVATESSNGAPARKRGLTGMVLAELRQLAGELNIADTAGMRKGELITAIKDRQGGGAKPRDTASTVKSDSPGGQLQLDNSGETRTGKVPAGASSAPAAEAPAGAGAKADAGAPADAGANADADAPPIRRRRRAASRPAGAPEQSADDAGQSGAAAEPKAESAASPQTRAADAGEPAEQRADQEPGEQAGDQRQGGRGNRDGANRDGANRDRQQNRGNDGGNKRTDRGEGGNTRTDAGGSNRTDRDGGGGNRTDRDDRNQGGGNRNDGGNNTRNDRDDDDDDDGTGRGRRGRRFRDRNRRGRDRQDRGREGGAGQDRQDRGGNVDTEVRDDDVLLPVAGILDVLDNYAFVRTTGYLSGPNDVYVSLSMVRRYGLRRGDAVTGAVRQPREGEQARQKFNPLVRVDSINGLDPEQTKDRPEFTKLTPLYPNERMRLETEPHKLTTRVIDLVMPIGKGQRALIVSPPKAGKTMVLQAIANAITTNNPECHLMVVLVDERPEEVTDMQRSVKGEVIASTFDRPPSDHTTVAELSIERAKRLVEMGMDVVVLLDSITRLGRAYNLAAPASGRILSGGVDSTALYPPKRFLGAARNIEDGGSLTILATALVETGSTMDTVIFEEFKGTGNAELKLDRKLADKRVFPAVDVADSGTRKEELLLAPDEMAVMVKLRRVLSALDDQQALDLVLTQLRKTRTNIEFLMQVAKNTPNNNDD